MAVEIDTLALQLEARINDFQKQMAKATGIAYSNADKIQKRFDGLNLGAKLKTPQGGLGGNLGGIGAGLGSAISVSQIQKYADAWQNAGNKLQAMGTPTELVSGELNRVADIAERSRNSFEAVSGLYTKLTLASGALGLSQNEVARLTETVSKSLVLSGASAGEASSSILQLGQALASGRLQGDEFRSLMENAPDLMKRLAASLEVTQGALKEMATDGKLTADVIVKALSGMAVDVDAAFGKTQATIAQSFTQLENAAIRYVGNSALIKSATIGVVQVLDFLKNNMDTVAGVAFGMAAAMLAAFAPFALAAAAALPLTAVLTGVAVAATMISSSLQPVGGELATIADYAYVAFDFMQAAGGDAAAVFNAVLQPAIDAVRGAMSGLGGGIESAGQIIKDVLNTIIGAFVFAYDTISASWNGLPAAIGDVAVQAFNSVLATIQNALNAVVSAINAVSSAAAGVTGINVGMVGEVNLGKLTTEYAGAGKATAESFNKAFNTDYLGNAGSVVKKAANTIRDKANDIAADREIEQIRLDEAAAKNAEQKRKAALAAAGGGGGGKGGGGAGKISDYDKTIEQLQKERRETEAAANSVGLLNAQKRANLEISRLGLDANSAEPQKIRELTIAIDENQQKIKQYESVKQAVSQLQDAFADAFTEVIVSGKKASDVFKDLANMLAKDSIKSLLTGKGMFAGLFGGSGQQQGGGGIFGSLLGGIFGAVTGGATGSAIPLPMPRPFAVGANYVPDDMIAQIHKGEMIIPAYDAEKIRNGTSSGGGSSNVMQVTINAPGADAAQLASVRAELQNLQKTFGQRVAMANRQTNVRNVRP